MTNTNDNQATELLRKLLDERGVEYEAYRDIKNRCITKWRTYHGAFVFFAVEKEGKLFVETASDTEHSAICTPEQAIAATLGSEINGDTSDGYHTFNELYHHRAVLFSVIVRDHRDIAWKARKHYDGTMYDGMFIVGIETPKGQATYHYDLDPYWEMFDCEEREFAPEWDGHTPDEAIARIAELGSGTCENDSIKRDCGVFVCSECGVYLDIADMSWDGEDDSGGFYEPRFCPECGHKVVG